MHIGDARYEGIEKAYNLTVKTDTLFDLQTAHHTIVGTDPTLNAKNIIIEGSVMITLKVGSSWIVLDPSGVYINGPMVMINSGGTPAATTDQEITDPTDATAAEPGDRWFKRVTSCDPHPRGGGGRRKRTVKAKHFVAPLPTKRPASVAGAPDRVQLPANVNKAMQDAFANSFPGRNKENGGTIVQDKDGNILVVNEGGAGSTSGTFSPDRNIAPDQTLVGTFHTHPYDGIRGRS